MTSGTALSFTAPADGPSEPAILLAMVFGIAAILSLSLWCAAGRPFGRLLRSDWQWRLTNMLLAILLVLSILPMRLP